MFCPLSQLLVIHCLPHRTTISLKFPVCVCPAIAIVCAHAECAGNGTWRARHLHDALHDLHEVRIEFLWLARMPRSYGMLRTLSLDNAIAGLAMQKQFTSHLSHGDASDAFVHEGRYTARAEDTSYGLMQLQCPSRTVSNTSYCAQILIRKSINNAAAWRLVDAPESQLHPTCPVGFVGPNLVVEPHSAIGLAARS